MLKRSCVAACGFVFSAAVCLGLEAVAPPTETTIILRLTGPSAPSTLSLGITIARRGEDPRNLALEIPAGTSGSRPRTLGVVRDPIDVVVRAKGYWSPVVAWNPGDPHEIQVPVFRTSAVQGPVQNTSGLRLPSNLWAEFEGTPGAAPPQVPRGRVLCSVVDHQWACSLPVGVVDVRLGQDGYVPEYYWNVEIAPSGQTSLGPLHLRQGSSVVGFLFEMDGQHPARGCRIEATTREGADILIGPARPGQPPITLGATTNDRGFFQIVGPAAGEYQLTVEARERGYLTTPVELVARKELRIPVQLVLQEPNVVDLGIQPPLDMKGRPWRVEVVDASRVPGRVVISRAADRSGRLRLLVPGARLLFFVLDADGQQWATRVVEAPPPHQVLEVELPLRFVHGTVRLGDLPLRCQLAFSSKGTRVALGSGPEGDFEGSLPAAATYDVEVAAEDPPVRRVLVNVSVPESGEIGLSLPDTQLHGRVVDVDRRPQAAIVTVRGMEAGAAEPAVQVRSDETGMFQIRGLPAGLVVTSADTFTRLQSDMYPSRLTEGETVHLELVARERVSLQGRLVSQATSEPIPGAAIKGIPTAAIVPHSGISKVTESDAEGRFQLSLPAGTREVDVVIMASGHALDMQRITFDHEKPIVLRVPTAGGTLAVEFDPALDRGDRAAPVIALLHNGARESLNYLLTSWAQPVGASLDATPLARIVLPGVAPGDYRVCVADWASLRQARFAADRCAQGTVPPGGEATLSLSLPSR